MKRTLSLLMITALFFTACTTNDNCKSCAGPPNAVEKVSFNLMNKSVAEQFNIYKFDSNDNQRESFATNNANDDLFQLVKSYCIHKKLTLDNQVLAIVLYYDLHLSHNLTVRDEHIRGISLYEVEGNKMMHRLYVRNNNDDFVEEENVKVRVSAITSNHINFYLEHYVFVDDAQNKSYILIEDFAARDTYNKLRKLYRGSPLQFEIINKAKLGGGTTCGGECEHGKRNESCERSTSGPVTWDCVGICPLQEVATCLIAEPRGGEVHEFIDTPLMYAFRDDVLVGSKKGEEYIDYYYFLGTEYQGKMSLDLAVQTATVLNDFNPVMEACLDPVRHASEIMFTPKLTADILALIDEYGKITTSSQGKKILSTIREDVISLKNLPLSAVLARR